MSAFIQGRGDVFGPIGAVSGNIPLFDGTTGKIIKDGGVPISVVSALPRGWIAGLTLSNNATDSSNDIDISEGECRDSTNAVDIVLSAPITKRVDAAWVVGTNQGGLDTGAVANSTSYHLWLIKRSDTGVVDVLFSTSATAPTMPANYTHKRRIGSIFRTTVFRAFTQLGDYFQINAPVNSHSGASIVQSASFLGALAGGTGSVPMGLKFLVDLQVSMTSTVAGGGAYCHDPDTTQPTVAQIVCPVANVINDVRLNIWDNSGATVRIASGSVVSTYVFNICPIGYWDPRKDG